MAIDRQNKREHLTAGQHDAIERDLYFADQNRKSGNLDEALKNVSHAESVLSKALREDTIATESLRVLYQKADILGAQGRIGDALAILDQYDLLAIDDERQPANQLRNQLLFQLDKTLKDLKAQIQKAVPEGRYHLARRLAEQGLRVKEDDPELLYAAGVASIVTRNQKESLPLLKRYLEVSGTVDGSGERRARVRRLLLSLKDTATPDEAGDPNWMSGKRLPRQVVYCPISLAFQPHIEHIEASNKMRVAFEWDGGRLKSITPSFEKPDQASGEQKLVFGYDRRVPQIASAGNEQAAPDPVDPDPDTAVRRSVVVLLNNPDVDPVAMKQLTGTNFAAGIAGNRFFNPFIWEKVYRFRFLYDDHGRVAQAREIDAHGSLGNLTVEFEWDGIQLSAVRGYEGSDEKQRVLMYERTLQYEGGRLVGEEIQNQGRQGKIKYVYKGDKLVSASCDKGSALDGRSRVVTFALN